MEKGWKEVYLTAQEYKADFAKELLENAGIKVVVMNQHDTAIKSFGDFVLYVSEKDEKRSVELLKELKN
ncbi:MAG TPA: DUF2007 domain-containing protein [Draconibacterium sp.]|nr:DUF2007 domain-containing protein [Draconibacterium sp.]